MHKREFKLPLFVYLHSKFYFNEIDLAKNPFKGCILMWCTNLGRTLIVGTGDFFDFFTVF